MFMQIDCVNAAQEPPINEKFINKVVKVHYPGIQMLLQNLEDPLAEIKHAELVRAGNKNIDLLLDEEKQKMNVSELLTSSTRLKPWAFPPCFCKIHGR